VEKSERGIVGSSRISEWQELITYDIIKDILDAELSIRPHPVPEGMRGTLDEIIGRVQAAERIMGRLEYRSKLFKGHTKPQNNEEEGKE